MKPIANKRVGERGRNRTYNLLIKGHFVMGAISAWFSRLSLLIPG